MTVLLLGQLVPLLILIGLGYVAGRWLQVQAHALAMIAIYFLAPVVNFGGVAQLKFQSAYLLLPPLLLSSPQAASRAGPPMARAPNAALRLMNWRRVMSEVTNFSPCSGART